MHYARVGGLTLVLTWLMAGRGGTKGVKPEPWSALIPVLLRCFYQRVSGTMGLVWSCSQSLLLKHVFETFRNEEVQKDFKEWGLHFGREPIDIRGRSLTQIRLVMSNNQPVCVIFWEYLHSSKVSEDYSASSTLDQNIANSCGTYVVAVEFHPRQGRLVKGNARTEACAPCGLDPVADRLHPFWWRGNSRVLEVVESGGTWPWICLQRKSAAVSSF